ncbi:hypothetical protein HME01_22770 [Vreelandella aquamarina]|uniref:Transcriptional regulator, TraR/DksA family n=1 Tax=Vreelandella aquamarina TaxID=77097 RepID=A0A1N6D6Z2_9GAMM|nr:TraR/DksA family transcriptional regulator [Halomonas meridiana]GED46425.1 hypothetical protein HME01_22770 [Halomonas meridiana]SIN66493.1 transcriptional regulator, TraR/DksA family [Halomonas meridiana]SIN79405.1 transcriptional regulator, TraR/DksA family [Halomonas meridiana]SIO34161.1 transcriptional regulator, TraR/DksA family [Halomonas meridiana]
MDKADVANDYIEWRTEQAINAQRQQSSAVASRAVCKECHEPIPAARRKALPGVQLCVACQTQMEGR